MSANMTYELEIDQEHLDMLDSAAEKEGISRPEMAVELISRSIERIRQGRTA